MYSTLKKIAKGIIPKTILQKNEQFFRSLIASKYAGSNAQCTICDFSLKHFVTRTNGDLLCPNCGSLSRTRRLYKTATETPLTGKVLHFSPPKSFSLKLKAITGLDYCTSDFAGEFETDYHYDITSISEQENTFDFIICYHVLEHIEDDIKAMTELYRVLKPNGCIFIQTPFKDGDIYEDYSIVSEEARRLAFGQEDHVRMYSVNGLNERLQSVGFKTEIIKTQNAEDTYYGFRPETYIKAQKLIS
ncbi:class I SAM-dependent methyltransferase [uncultured Winogradskyella sp.]|uniref:class I SAM-dependent methyltransferase n=1 Tax=uncultured Winogradskyella sp. TaxID=395353 RepID=UPI0030D7AC8D